MEEIEIMETMETRNQRYSITLADGTVLHDLELNGDNYISHTPIDPAVFEDNLTGVIISDGENSEEHAFMKLVHLTPMFDGWWFTLRDISTEELERMRLQSDIEYLAMMTGVDL